MGLNLPSQLLRRSLDLPPAPAARLRGRQALRPLQLRPGDRHGPFPEHRDARREPVNELRTAGDQQAARRPDEQVRPRPGQRPPQSARRSTARRSATSRHASARPCSSSRSGRSATNIARSTTPLSRRYPNLAFAWSYKTNYLAAICAVMHQEGALAEVVSEMEYAKARALGVPGEQIIFNGPLKPRAALERAVADGRHGQRRSSRRNLRPGRDRPQARPQGRRSGCA